VSRFFARNFSIFPILIFHLLPHANDYQLKPGGIYLEICHVRVSDGIPLAEAHTRQKVRDPQGHTKASSRAPDDEVLPISGPINQATRMSQKMVWVTDVKLVVSEERVWSK